MPYNSQTFEYDWLIVKLNLPLEINSNVQPACLPSSSKYLSLTSTDERCFICGWGAHKSGVFIYYLTYWKYCYQLAQPSLKLTDVFITEFSKLRRDPAIFAPVVFVFTIFGVSNHRHPRKFRSKYPNKPRKFRFFSCPITT